MARPCRGDCRRTCAGWICPRIKAKELADLIATTDGIIYTFQFDGRYPNGRMRMAQMVGRRPTTATE
jgi:hypothetical protein